MRIPQAAQNPFTELMDALLGWLIDAWHPNRILVVWVPFMALAVAGAVLTLRSVW